MNNIKTLIFDLEGVIIDSEPIWDDVDTEFLRRRGIKFAREKSKHLMMGKSLADGAKVLMEVYGFSGDPEALGAERREIAKELFEKEVEFMPGFLKFFQSTARNYPRAIATSLERHFLNAVDAKLQLVKMFDGHIYSIQDIGYISKPDPAIFMHAAKQLGAKPAECLVIEDAPNGVAAARAAGMRCVAITNTVSRDRLVGADQIVDTYADIHIP